MPQPAAPQPGLSLDIGDIYYTLFRHKWKLLICTLLGLGAAAAVYKLKPPPYQSDARLYIRYVLSEKQISAIGPDATAKSPDQRGETIMGSEAQILMSTDLANQVADAVGPEKILAKFGGGKDPVKAAAIIHGSLSVEIPDHSSVIHLVFKHPDPTVVQPVMRELISHYLKMHREVHESVGILGDFLTQETDQLRARLAQTEDDLRKACTKADIVSSVDDAKKTYADEITDVRQRIFNAQAELAERQSAYEAMAKLQHPSQPSQPAPESAKAGSTVAPGVADDYRAALARIDYLSKVETDLLLQFTPESDRVKEVHGQLAAAKQAKQKLEEQYPDLIRTAPEPKVLSALPATANLPAAAIEISALQAKIKTLNAQLEQLTGQASKLSEMEATISELRRRQQLEENNYKHFSESLEQSRLDEALGNGRVSNISIIESPTPPATDWRKLYKLLGALAAGGVIAGIAWAFAIELYLDRSIRRPIDIERHVRLPLFISIPRLKAKAIQKTKTDLPPDTAAPLHPFHETLRDRLIGYFESRNLTHKPKLVAITSLGRSAGVTTTAIGLSQSLSETAERNVLLVDMTAGHGSALRFSDGKALSDLDEALEHKSTDDESNLYIVAAESNSEQLSRNLPQRFSKLVPKLKASNFDYIIFDLPPVSQISITPRLAGFMDMVLLVVDSEKTDRNVVQRAASLLTAANAQVGTVLNNMRSYVPPRLQPEVVAAI